MIQVSIGIPVFNGERYLEQSMRSICEQTYGDFELLIYDNASTDRTAEISRDYLARDKRIRYFRNETNIGAPANFNRVFQLCRGRYHKWSTADDLLDRTLLAKSVEVLEREPEVVLCYPKTALIDPRNELLSYYEDNLHLQDHFPSERFSRLLDTIGLCNAHLGLIRREVLSRTALIGPHMGSDVSLLAELSLRGRFFVIPEYLYFRRFHPESSSWDRQDTQRQRNYYDPDNRAHFGMHIWKNYLALLGAVRRAPIGRREKFRSWRYLGRRFRWDRVDLSREVYDQLRHVVASLFLSQV